jgi:hypothetical protein
MPQKSSPRRFRLDHSREQLNDTISAARRSDRQKLFPFTGGNLR